MDFTAPAIQTQPAPANAGTKHDPLGMAVGLGQTGVGDEAVAVLHQRMSHEAELRFLARPLAVKPRLRIGRRGVRLVRALLTMEIRLAVPPSAGRRRVVRSVSR